MHLLIFVESSFKCEEKNSYPDLIPNPRIVMFYKMKKIFYLLPEINFGFLHLSPQFKGTAIAGVPFKAILTKCTNLKEIESF